MVPQSWCSLSLAKTSPPVVRLAFAIASVTMREGDSLTNSIVVEGHAVVVTPDAAMLQVSLQTEADTAADALALVSERSEAVLSAARGAGVAVADLQTRGLSLFPQMDDRGQRVVCYRASYSLGVRLREVARASAVVEAVGQAAGDALRLGGFHLSTSETDSARSEAGAKAVRDARERAELLAEAAGVRVGRVVSIVADRGFIAPSGVRPMRAVAAGAAVPAPPLEPGSGEISAHVTVTFEISD
jgi:uncharacterized protein YggE